MEDVWKSRLPQDLQWVVVSLLPISFVHCNHFLPPGESSHCHFLFFVCRFVYQFNNQATELQKSSNCSSFKAGLCGTALASWDLISKKPQQSTFEIVFITWSHFSQVQYPYKLISTFYLFRLLTKRKSRSSLKLRLGHHRHNPCRMFPQVHLFQLHKVSHFLASLTFFRMYLR